MVRKKLSIGFVFDDSLDKTDGIQQYVLNLGSYYTSLGHDVHYLVGETKRTDLKQVHSLARNVSVRFNHNRMSMPLPTPYAVLAKLLRETHFDVLHVMMPYSPWLAHRIIATAEPSTAVIGTFHIVAHSKLVSSATRGLATWTRKSLKRFDDIVAVSSAAASYAKETYHIDCAVIPNVVDYDSFHDAVPLTEYADDRNTILFLGRLVPRKGCLLLLQAVAKLKKVAGLPDYRVLLCGKGPLEQELRAYVAAQELDDIVEFVGFVEEAIKPRYYASADISVFPSTGGESFGIVLLEAMASGKAAVLAGDNSGYRSVMSPREDLLFTPTNTNQLAGLLQTMLLDAKKRRAAAVWGADYARAFNIPTVGDMLLDRYETALLNRAPKL